MTPDDIRDLFRFKGGHEMARVAARPDLEIEGWKRSTHGLYAWPERVDTEKTGIRFTNEETGASRVVTWRVIRAHAIEHTSDEIFDWILAIDREWCEVKSMPDVPPGQWRYSTAAEDARIAQCERWLEHLARIVWDPALVAPEPYQQTIFDALEAMTE